MSSRAERFYPRSISRTNGTGAATACRHAHAYVNRHAIRNDIYIYIYTYIYFTLLPPRAYKGTIVRNLQAAFCLCKNTRRIPSLIHATCNLLSTELQPSPRPPIVKIQIFLRACNRRAIQSYLLLASQNLSGEVEDSWTRGDYVELNTRNSSRTFATRVVTPRKVIARLFRKRKQRLNKGEHHVNIPVT